MSIDQLNAEFAIPGQLSFVSGNGGLPMIAIDNDHGRALISVYAGQLLSYQPAGEPHDLLFVSDRAFYQPGKAIKGGVPVCWPWFGPDPEQRGRPAHGFVRNRPWQVTASGTTTEGATRVTLGLADDADTRSLWPHAFNLDLTVTVGARLDLELVTGNAGQRPFVVSQALHSYFAVGDIRDTRVLGLDGARYLDKVDGGAERTQCGPVVVDGEVDRIYLDAPAELVIEDAALGRRIHITASGSASAVVWNPWAAIAAQMADLDDGDYRHMLCVETANAATDQVTVPAGGVHRLAASYRVTRD